MIFQSDHQAAFIQHSLDLINNNKLQEAKELLTQVCENDPLEADAWYLLSSVYGWMGEITASGECCRRALDIQPDHCEANLNLGNVLHSQGQLDNAMAQYRRVLQLNPNHALAHTNFGNLLVITGKYDEAALHYQEAIRIDPTLFIAFYNFGNLRMMQELFDKAANCYKRAIQIDPNHAISHNSLGIALMKLNYIDEALRSFRNAVRINPEYADAYNNMGNIYLGQGSLTEALKQYQRAILFAPPSSEAHKNLGATYLELGKLDKAISCFKRALEINPQDLAVLSNLGLACLRNGNLDSFMTCYQSVVEQSEDTRAARNILIQNIQYALPVSYNQFMDEELKKCLMLSSARYKAIPPYIAQHLKLKYKIPQHSELDRDELESLIKLIAADELFLMYLKKTINTDAAMELLLTNIRSQLLYKELLNNYIDLEDLTVASSLAFQCMNNEHVLATDETEDQLLLRLRNRIAQSLASRSYTTEGLERQLFVFAMYEGLYSLSCREDIIGIPPTTWSDSFRSFLKKTLISRNEEEKIKRDISAIGAIEDKTSLAVRSQYEENPYPRWLYLPKTKKTTISRSLQQRFEHFTPPSFLDGPIRILVAGCGTGQHPIHTALTFENTEILAIDLSKNALAYAIRMARKYNVTNIKFMQADILKLPELDMRFHLIECFGVLHHMEEPIKGWSVLTDLLVDSGIMYIGLYSEIARKQIVIARELIANENILPDKSGIRNFRNRLLTRELGTPELYDELSKSYDFYSTSRCRDLLFHYREHRFTLPQLNHILNDLNLDFVGFSFDNTKHKITNIYQAQFPEDIDMTDLSLWDRLENLHPYTFSKCYSFWCQKRSAPQY